VGFSIPNGETGGTQSAKKCQREANDSAVFVGQRSCFIPPLDKHLLVALSAENLVQLVSSNLVVFEHLCDENAPFEDVLLENPLVGLRNIGHHADEPRLLYPLEEGEAMDCLGSGVGCHVKTGVASSTVPSESLPHVETLRLELDLLFLLKTVSRHDLVRTVRRAHLPTPETINKLLHPALDNSFENEPQRGVGGDEGFHPQEGGI
jgi:hypothetical protein